MVVSSAAASSNSKSSMAVLICRAVGPEMLSSQCPLSRHSEAARTSLPARSVPSSAMKSRSAAGLGPSGPVAVVIAARRRSSSPALGQLGAQAGGAALVAAGEAVEQPQVARELAAGAAQPLRGVQAGDGRRAAGLGRPGGRRGFGRSGRAGAGARQPARQGLVQGGRRDGFGQVVVHAGLQAALAVFLESVGGERQDRGCRLAG